MDPLTVFAEFATPLTMWAFLAGVLVGFLLALGLGAVLASMFEQ